MKVILKNLAVVVLFWNDSEKTIKCLHSLINQKKTNFDIVLVDNNSDKKFSNKILKWIKKKKINLIRVKKNKIFEKKKSDKIIFYIKNKINYGCGLGHNYGFKFCLKNNYQYIARIDNDMIAPQFLIKNLLDRMSNNLQIGGVSPKVMFEDNPKQIWFGGTKVGNNLKFQKECSNHLCKIKDSKNIRGLIKTDAIVGCASLLRSKFLRKIRLSDPDFFYGEEDIELSHRLKKIGCKLFVDLDQKIYHSISHTVGANWAKTIYYNYKYRLVLIKKIGSKADKFFGYSTFLLKFILMLILSFKKKYSSRIIQIFYAGIHFLQQKYGEYDRKKYETIDAFFFKINKQTSLLDVIIHLNSKNKIL